MVLARRRRESRHVSSTRLSRRGSPRRTDNLMDRPAYGYVSLPLLHAPDAEIRLRRSLADFAMLEGLDLESIFVDHRGTQPYGFAALHVLIRRTGVRIVVLPDLTHVEHIATVNALTQA